MVAVEVRKGAVHRSGPNKVDFEREVVQGQAQFDVSMGIPGIENVSSTFGGFIELKGPTTGQWKTFGLSCFHYVVAPEGYMSSALLEREYIPLD